MKAVENVLSEPPIPTLAELAHDGLYLVAYCPICDKSERAKIDYPGQPRNNIASVLKIRAHMQQRHRRKLNL